MIPARRVDGWHARFQAGMFVRYEDHVRLEDVRLEGGHPQHDWQRPDLRWKGYSMRLTTIFIAILTILLSLIGLLINTAG